MLEKNVDFLVLGAGPAGLSAAYRIARSGRHVIVADKDLEIGGSMRSIRRGEFTLDLGRKELYRSFPSVCKLWDELLEGGEMRPYNRRVGILYGNRIIEKSSYYLGPRCAMPLSLLVHCGLDYLLGYFNRSSKKRSLQDYRYQQHGRRFGQVLYQGYEEALFGNRWSEMPYPDGAMKPESVVALTGDKIARATAPANPQIRYHPLRGTGLIVERLGAGITQAGGEFQLGAFVKRITHSAQHIESVTLEIGSAKVVINPNFVISGISLPYLGALLKGGGSGRTAANHAPVTANSNRRSTVLVYLFLNEPVIFPHVWLEVTTPGKRFRRFTNYSAFNADMVPLGQGCLCAEIFCNEDDAVLTLDDDSIVAKAVREAENANLISSQRVFDTLVLRLPGGDAGADSGGWKAPALPAPLAFISQFDNLYDINRGGMENAMCAGLESAAPFLSEKA